MVVVDSLFIVITPIVGVCHCSMFCCSFLVAFLSFVSLCLVIVVWLFFVVPWVSLQFVIVAYPDHTHLLYISNGNVMIYLCSTSFVVKLKMSQNFRQRNENLIVS